MCSISDFSGTTMRKHLHGTNNLQRNTILVSIASSQSVISNTTNPATYVLSHSNVFSSELTNPGYMLFIRQFALRWRTEEEVLSGLGETTCGNTRCQHHFAPRFQGGGSKSSLTTLELPFSYVEQGENKSALVKVALCQKCVKKLMWKRQKEKATTELDLQTSSSEVIGAGNDDEEDPLAKRRKKQSRDDISETRRRRSSRSHSPGRPPTSDTRSRRP